MKIYEMEKTDNNKKIMDYIEKLLLEYSRYINNGRLESDEDCLNVIDEFLTQYEPDDRIDKNL